MGVRSKGYYVSSTLNGRQVREHVKVVELVLGKPLPAGAIVHHWDENPRNNTPSNLAVFPSEAYHKLIHRRTQAYAASGNANNQKCQYCGDWDSPAYMSSIQKSDRPSITYWHAGCRNSYRRKMYNHDK